MADGTVARSSRAHRTICLPISEDSYTLAVDDPAAFRRLLDEGFLAPPELFPPGFGRGYDRGMGPARMDRNARYGGDFAHEPFMPEAAYLRHPEYETPSTYHQDRWERPGEYVVSRDQPLGDEEIRNEVRQRLYQDTWLQADDIEVTVRGGIVTLRGEVHDFLEARYAWDDAWESDGVRGVINNLTVRPDEPGTEHHGDMFAQDTEGHEHRNG